MVEVMSERRIDKVVAEPVALFGRNGSLDYNTTYGACVCAWTQWKRQPIKGDCLTMGEKGENKMPKN